MSGFFKLFSGYQKVDDQHSIPNPNDTIRQMEQMQSQQQQQHLPGSSYMIEGFDPLSDLAALEKMNAKNTNTNPTQSAESKSWFSRFFSSPAQHDEMNLQYDIESGQSAAQVMQAQKPLDGQEQDMGFVQRNAVKLANLLSSRAEPLKKYIPVFPELTYAQRMMCFVMFVLGGVILTFNALTILPKIILPGRAASFAWSISIANIFFTCASLFVVSYQSLFTPQRRFTTTLYFTSIFLTILVATYFQWAVIVFPFLALQVACMVLNIISFFSSSLSIQTDISQAIVSSFIRRSI